LNDSCGYSNYRHEDRILTFFCRCIVDDEAVFGAHREQQKVTAAEMIMKVNLLGELRSI